MILTLSAGSAEYTDYIVADLPNVCSGYKTNQYDGEASVMLELWGMQSNPPLPSLPDPRYPGVVAHDRVLSLGQIELFDI